MLEAPVLSARCSSRAPARPRPPSPARAHRRARIAPGVPRVCSRQCPRAQAGAAVVSVDVQERPRAAKAQARSARPGIASFQRPPILTGIVTQLGSRRPEGRRRLNAQTRPASAEHVAPISKAPAITERLQRLPRRRRRPCFTPETSPLHTRPRFTHDIRVLGSANHGVATLAPPLATTRHGSTTHHRLPHEASPTHPCTTHLHLHRTHYALTSPPATRSPHPLPCPS